MSKCISSHGEYSSHENDEFHTCKWCGMFDEAVVLKKLEAAEVAIERVREALARHPECDRYDEGPISCGWKRAVADITAALEGDDE